MFCPLDAVNAEPNTVYTAQKHAIHTPEARRLRLGAHDSHDSSSSEKTLVHHSQLQSNRGREGREDGNVQEHAGGMS